MVLLGMVAPTSVLSSSSLENHGPHVHFYNPHGRKHGDERRHTRHDDGKPKARFEKRVGYAQTPEAQDVIQSDCIGRQSRQIGAWF